MFKYILCFRYFRMKLFQNNDYNTYVERYQKVLLDLSELQQSLVLLKIRVDGLELENSDLRDKVLRKIQKPKGQTEEQAVLPVGGKVKHGNT